MWEFVLSMLRGTALWPTAVSLVVALAIHAVPVRFASGGVAVACGFFAGWASQDWGRLQPERYLDWSPYIALLLAAVACITLMTSRHGLRWCLWLAACGIAAWLLVPDFPRLFPPRTVSVALVAALGGLTAGVVATFEDRLPRRACTSAHLMTGSAAALILAQSYGLKFSQMAGMLTAALAGPFLLASPGGKRHTSIVFLPLLAAILFMGYANSSSDVPVFCYFLPVTAAIPLLLQRQPSSTDSREGVCRGSCGRPASGTPFCPDARRGGIRHRATAVPSAAHHVVVLCRSDSGFGRRARDSRPSSLGRGTGLNRFRRRGLKRGRVEWLGQALVDGCANHSGVRTSAGINGPA